MAAAKIFLVFLVLALVTCPALSRRPRPGSNADAELTNNTSKNGGASEDFSLESGFFGTLGSLASSLFRSIFGGSASPREGGGFLSTIGGLLCNLLGGILGSICASDPGTDSMDVPVNLTYGELKEAADIIRKNISLNTID
ncbi:Hypothetical predicted protein [Cloeon dipterum]|uniref:Uncharacterized protein n=1 Tax=Cloeon dipterum TaxID=197152 RepID=A0A8S1DWC9_9INSE|nr:Hypothetical predicted protein [Cloeon dipterum]